MNQIDGASSQMLLGKYEIISKLGQGTMGMVYKGFDPSIERYVALKTISPHILNMDNPSIASSTERFKQEAKIAGHLNHPNIVSVYDFGEDEKTIFIVMEFVEGQDLKAILQKQQGALDLSISIRIMSQLLDALQHAHDKGIVHRDIKPGNIIVTQSEDIKVTDFGIAKIDSSELTQMGTLLGTPSYMSPEMINGKHVDSRSDIFSASVVFYQCLTGCKPFEGTHLQAMNKIENQAHVPPSKIVSGLSFELDRIMDKALAKNPDHRYSTALAMRNDLRMLIMERDGTSNDATVLMQTSMPVIKKSPSGQEDSFPEHKEEYASDALPKPTPDGPSFSWALILSLILFVVAVVGGLFVYYDRFHPVKQTSMSDAKDNPAPQATVKPEPLQPDLVNHTSMPNPAPLKLTSGEEKAKILQKTMEIFHNKLSMPVLLDLLKLKIAVQLETEHTDPVLIYSIDALEDRIANIDRVVQVTQGQVDLICTLKKSGGASVIIFENRFQKNEPDAFFFIDDLLGNREDQVTIESVINKLYALNIFDLMHSFKPPVGRDSYIEFSGTQDDIFHIGDITDICVHPDQTSELILLNINSLDITMLFPHFWDQKTHIQAGTTKCTGKAEIYPPAGTEMMVAFFLKNSELLDKVGYTLSEKTEFCSWPYAQNQACEFCENLMLRLLRSVNKEWSVDTRIIQIKN